MLKGQKNCARVIIGIRTLLRRGGNVSKYNFQSFETKWQSTRNLKVHLNLLTAFWASKKAWKGFSIKVTSNLKTGCAGEKASNLVKMDKKSDLKTIRLDQMCYKKGFKNSLRLFKCIKVLKRVQRCKIIALQTNKKVPF